MKKSEWVKVGTKVEMEHTKDSSKARRIAMDHLDEDKDYYKDWANKEKVLFQPKVNKSEGEGSRGGKVVGHTKSGEPIYERKNEKPSAIDRQTALLKMNNQGLRLEAQKNNIDVPMFFDMETKGRIIRQILAKEHPAPAGMNKSEGEGSRGGVVIGHTSGGKPVYQNHTNRAHDKFTARDHKDAMAIHKNRYEAEKANGNFGRAADEAASYGHHHSSLKHIQEQNKSKMTHSKGAEIAREGLKKNGWDVKESDASFNKLKVPHATSPNGKHRIYFKAQSMHHSYQPEGGNHSLSNARSMMFDAKHFAQSKDPDMTHEAIANHVKISEPLVRSNVLTDLVNDIRKSAKVFQPAVVRRPAQTFATNNDRVVKGVGGVIFNFGNMTGNPMADNATRLLQRHGDPVQAQVATDQNRGFQKALHDFVRTGGEPDVKEGVHGEWNKQFSKGLDQQVVDAIKSGELQVENTKGASTDIKGSFNKSQMILGGEEITAQSETDAAVIEMMKSSMQDTAEDGEFVIDATRGM